jgi:hypothetical protein
MVDNKDAYPGLQAEVIHKKRYVRLLPSTREFRPL